MALHASGNQVQNVYPIYPRSWLPGVAQVRDFRVLKLYGEASLLEQRIKDTAILFLSRLLWFSPTCHLVWRSTNRLLEKKLRETKVAIESFVSEEEAMRAGQGYHPASEPQMYKNLVQIWEASSRQMRHLCEGNGIQYFYFLQPNQYVEGSKVLNEGELKFAFVEDHPYRSGVKQGYPLLRESGARLAAEGESFTDLTETFKSIPKQVYLDDCCHFGPIGNRIIADRIAEAIIAQPHQE